MQKNIGGSKKNNNLSNLKKISKAKHNKVHPEKGGNRKCKKGHVWNMKIKKCLAIK